MVGAGRSHLPRAFSGEVVKGRDGALRDKLPVGWRRLLPHQPCIAPRQGCKQAAREGWQQVLEAYLQRLASPAYPSPSATNLTSR